MTNSIAANYFDLNKLFRLSVIPYIIYQLLPKKKKIENKVVYQLLLYDPAKKSDFCALGMTYILGLF